MKIHEGSRHTFCFIGEEIITKLTFLFVSLYFKVPPKIRNGGNSVAFHKQSEMRYFQKSVVGGADGDDVDKPVVG